MIAATFARPAFDLVRMTCRSLGLGLARLSPMWSLVQLWSVTPTRSAVGLLARLHWTAYALLSRRAQETASSVLMIIRQGRSTATVSARHLWLIMAGLTTQTAMMRHTQCMDPSSRVLTWMAIARLAT